MGIRRTKLQSSANQFEPSKQVKLAQVKYSYRAADPTPSRSARNPALKADPTSAKDLFAYDVKLIYQDLTKTVIITAVMILLLIGMTWYLRR